MLHKKIGILGGGQLGKMIYQAGSQMGLNISILDKSVQFPAAQVCPNFVVGDFQNEQDVLNFAKNLDVISIEIESVNLKALQKLEDSGKEVWPSCSIIEIVQDKGNQKNFYKESNLPSPDFVLVDGKQEILQRIENGKLKFPFVQKLRRGGYDGRGVELIENINDLESLMEGPSVIENKIQIKKELAVIVSRNKSGDLCIYDPVEMTFDSKANLLDYQICPARITDETSLAAKELARTLAEKMQLVGILAVELFLDIGNKLWINEMAPRPHNSGHHTIESCVTSQYEQLLRAILNLPLGETTVISPSVLLNLLGDTETPGPARIYNADKCLRIPGAHLHIYGKAETKAFRKMGHVTIVDKDLHSAIEKANYIKKHVKIST